MLVAMIGTETETSILHRLLDSDEPLPPEVARFFLGLKLSEKDLQQIRELSEKANEGDLTSEDRDQLSTYIIFNELLVIMQSRARASISKQSPAA
jgi:hypothetical protein